MSVQPSPGFNPYQAPTAAVEAPTRVEGYVPASRGARLGAALLDGVVLAVPLIVIGMASGFTRPASGDGSGGPAVVMMGLMSLVILGYFIFTAILFSRTNQTVGKKLLGIRVRRSDGSHCSLGRAIFLRNGVLALVGMIPILGSIVGLVDPLMIFREDRRTLHDLIADTIVTEL